MQRRVKGPLVHLQDLLGHLLDTLGDPPSVMWTQGEGFEDKEVESPLQKVGLSVGHFYSPFLS
jgi:hypothetical protein